MTRREFLKNAMYAIFALPVFSVISKILKHPKAISSEQKPKEAMYYNKLAG
jgi:hypothetical protein